MSDSISTVSNHIENELRFTNYKQDSPIILSESTFAHAFYGLWQEKYLYIIERDIWYVRDPRSGRYVADEKTLMPTRAMDKLITDVVNQVHPDQTAKTHKAARARWCKSSVYTASLKIARSMPKMSCSINDLDTNPYLLGIPCGVIDLRYGVKSGRLATFEDKVTKTILVDPDLRFDFDSGKNFYRFIMDACGYLGGDHEQHLNNPDRNFPEANSLISYIHTMLGYCLTGLTTEHKAFYFHGKPNSGKSTLSISYQHMLGDYGVAIPIQHLTKNMSTPHRQWIAAMQGKRFASAREPEDGQEWATEELNGLIAGEPVDANFMRQNSFTFTPTAKFVISGNHLPGFPEGDGIRRRFDIIPFNRVPDNIDKSLLDKLFTESKQIAYWCIEGARLFLSRQELQASPLIRSATKQWQGDSEPFSDWVTSQLEEVDMTIRTSDRQLHVSYTDYCFAIGLPRRKVWRKLRFRRELDKLFPNACDGARGNETVTEFDDDTDEEKTKVIHVYWYDGLRLK